jgi:hypothetical protein
VLLLNQLLLLVLLLQLLHVHVRLGDRLVAVLHWNDSCRVVHHFDFQQRLFLFADVASFHSTTACAVMDGQRSVSINRFVCRAILLDSAIDPFDPLLVFLPRTSVQADGEQRKGNKKDHGDNDSNDDDRVVSDASLLFDKNGDRSGRSLQIDTRLHLAALVASDTLVLTSVVFADPAKRQIAPIFQFRFAGTDNAGLAWQKKWLRSRWVVMHQWV